MKRFLFSAALCAFIASSGTISAQTARYKTDLPPPVVLEYAIKANQRGIPLDGSAVVRWSAADRKFTVVTETRANLLGKIMDARSEGAIDEFGLAPTSFNEKRFGKSPTSTSFDRSARQIRFSASNATYPINGGEQDRNSIVWQLVSVARGDPARFKPGSEWTFFVAGQRDAEAWTFKVQEREKVKTPLGEFETLQISRLPPDGKGQQLDIWLAPKRDWYPVRLRFADEEDGDYIDQKLVRMERKA